ncbi:MAG TPA: tol-pal system protein YbgF [Burkholderiaceae bacterium]|nr:tol-pal system protein YbgF [Burkholderiaceae bacterium]
MIRSIRLARLAATAGLALAALAAGPSAHAGLFDDDEARRAILDIRQRIDQNNKTQTDANARLAEQVEQLRRSVLDLNNQLEQLRAENARLRGTDEQLARDLSELQRKQKDIQSGVDDRIRRFEPQKVTLDGKEFSAEPEEKKQYDDAMEALRRSDYQATANGLSTLRKRWPSSGYTESALFWLGNAQYGLRQYRDAITSFRSLISSNPESPKAPEALLAVANCQAELKDTKSARRTIEELLKTYPKSEAAAAGRERLASLK